MDIKVKQKLNLEVRIPEWTSLDQVKCEIDGISTEVTFDGRYADVGKVEAGQKVMITFPISEKTETVQIQGPPGGVNDYTIIRRGNTIVSIDPPGRYIPLYQRGHYREGKTLYRKVTRFIPEDEFAWW